MTGNSEEDETPREKSSWMEEIIRETEHFYQAEGQQDQRGSWLLASVAVLIVAWASLEIVIIENNYSVSQVLMILTLILFVACCLTIVINLMPLRGEKYLRDLFGSKYRKEAALRIEELIEQRFRPNRSWSQDSLENRVMYHYRSHYLRNFCKAYGVLWSSLLLLIGVITFAFALASLPFAF